MTERDITLNELAQGRARATSSASLRWGVMPTGGRHGARPGCSFRMSSVVA